MKLGLLPGDALILQPLGRGEGLRYHAQVIGLVPERSLLITAPDEQGHAAGVHEGEGFVVRAFVGGRAVAFRSTVLRVCVQPFRYVHMAYPLQLEEVVVRSGERIQVERNAHVSKGAGKPPVPAVISDVSTTGAMLDASVALGAVGDALMIETSFRYEGLPEQPVQLPALIKNVEEHPAAGGQPANYRIGVQFRELTPAVALAVRAFVYETLIRERQG